MGGRNHADGGRRRRDNHRNPAAFDEHRLQPVRQRHQVQPQGWQRHGHGGGARWRGGPLRLGHGNRHPHRAPRADFRAILPRGQEPLQGDGRHGSRPFHRQARRPPPPRDRYAPEREWRRVYVHGEIPAGVREKTRGRKKETGNENFEDEITELQADITKSHYFNTKITSAYVV